MNLAFEQFIPTEFHPSSRVWIYQSNRIFSMPEALALEPVLQQFAANWKSHGTPVKGFANLLFGQFIVVMADETATGVSGCSTDSSVRVIKQIEEQFKVSLFDRQMLAFYLKDKVELLPLSQLKYAFENNFINAGTLYFNNLVATKEELLNNWIIPVQESWLAKKIPALQA
ncbi:hypothetical protein [Foetidibacter luteolus]|uniref:hypothetical protein n=1 Tax=Foetidibacter luteolus TaxID=2608880 RepID=UPI00129B5231|nr:hypothetical protein [Foetidibacter luteolus]